MNRITITYKLQEIMFPDHDVFDAPDFEDTVYTNSLTAIYYHDDFIKHSAGNHPETPERLVVMKKAIESHPINDSLDWLEPGLCKGADILRCHTASHLERIKNASEITARERGGTIWLDPDTYVNSDTYRAACRAVGASCEAVDLVLAEKYQSVWCLVRPPGHHAMPDRAMGFCLFNNAACAAQYAREIHKLERVMIIDIDLHHGNGTQDIFYDDRGVLYTSIHQAYHYPGTGHINEIGIDDGCGYTINFPVLARSGDCEFAFYLREIVAPVVWQYKPQLLIVSMGYDGHEKDPLGHLQVSTEEYGRFVTFFRAAGTEFGIGIVYTLEGGYSLDAQAETIVECMIASRNEHFEHGNLPMPYRPSQGSLAAQDRLRDAHKGIWDL